MSSTTPVARPFFLDGSAGQLFCLHSAAENPGPGLRGVLVLPPFAEELNKCRRMLALAARSLQRAGSDVLLVDLPACRAATLKRREATDTFARRAWRDWVALQTARFVREQPGGG